MSASYGMLSWPTWPSEFTGLVITNCLSQPGSGFLEALTSEKVTTFLDTLQKVTPNGFLDRQGKEHEADVIICATG